MDDGLYNQMQQDLAVLGQRFQVARQVDPLGLQRMGLGGWMDNGEPMNGWVAPRDLRGNPIALMHVPRANRWDVGGIGNVQNHINNEADEEEEPDHNHRHEQDRVEAELRRTIARLEEEARELKDNVKEKERWIRQGGEAIQSAHATMNKIIDDRREEIAALREDYKEEIDRLRRDKDEQKRDYENRIEDLKKQIDGKEKKVEELASKIENYRTSYETRELRMEQEKNEVAEPSSSKKKRVQ